MQMHYIEQNTPITTNSRIYLNFTLNTTQGQMTPDHIELLHGLIMRIFMSTKKITAILFKLKFPKDSGMADDIQSNPVIARFIETIEASVQDKIDKIPRKRTYINPPKIRHVWCREYDNKQKPYFNVLLLLDSHSLHKPIGFDRYSRQMTGTIQQAWADTIGIPHVSAQQLVEFPVNAVMQASNEVSSTQMLFNQTSHLCKTTGKQYSPHYRSFGCSYE